MHLSIDIFKNALFCFFKCFFESNNCWCTLSDDIGLRPEFRFSNRGCRLCVRMHYCLRVDSVICIKCFIFRLKRLLFFCGGFWERKLFLIAPWVNVLAGLWLIVLKKISRLIASIQWPSGFSVCLWHGRSVAQSLVGSYLRFKKWQFTSCLAWCYELREQC